MIHFPRATLAKQLADAMQGQVPFGDAHNGLFLAAPRRTGKSTFLQSDLKPELERRGVVVVYVDLWADMRRDPAALIAEAVGRALEPHLGAIAKMAKGAKLESASVMGWLKFDTSNIGKVDGVTLPEALRTLHETSKAPIALIVDEAQHALTSEAGEGAMTALKSARDQLNSPGKIVLMLVMSGSDRDKLLRLVNTGGAPFYGSEIQRMPEMGRDFIDHIARLIESHRPDQPLVDAEALLDAFRTFGCRPQFFMNALGQVLSPVAGLSVTFEAALLIAAKARQHQDEAQMASDYSGLRPLEQVVLWRMLEQGQLFKPYDAEALKSYKDRTGDKTVTVPKVQTALEGLRQRQPPIIWKSARGEYAVEDAAMHRWYERAVASKTWPQTD